ncbi:hypothetical protein L3Q82_004672 [Scortum barcoo]|uniref:Uncharacterized protein n=1 Tax=Scortum barcoo TaxID=214431 RepID=A0ACB8VH22_9TELE|nr:hypothetical protein L3Q82_004672 [Scortum barcoo]
MRTSRSPDASSDVRPWPISGLPSADVTFSARLSSLGTPASSDFNTVIPEKLILKLHNLLGLPSSLCHWIRDFLTNRPQVVRIGETHILYTGPEHRHTTALFTLFTSSPVSVLPSTPQTPS